MAAVALRLINKFGKTVSFNVVSGESYDPTTGGTTGASSSTVNRKISPPSPVSFLLDAFPNAKPGTAECFVAASGLTFTPSVNQQLTIDSVVWTITELMPIYSGDDIAAYGMLIRS